MKRGSALLDVSLEVRERGMGTAAGARNEDGFDTRLVGGQRVAGEAGAGFHHRRGQQRYAKARSDAAQNAFQRDELQDLHVCHTAPSQKHFEPSPVSTTLAKYEDTQLCTRRNKVVQRSHVTRRRNGEFFFKRDG